MVCGCTNRETRTEVLRFGREALLYDIRNYAYIEGEVLGEETQHAQHTLVDVGEEGNIDRVDRILGAVHAGVVDMLYPYTKVGVEEEVLDNSPERPEEYVVVMQVPETFSKTTLRLLTKLIHEYMVYRVLADWLGITNPQGAERWEAKAERAAEEINNAKHQRGVVLRRKASPY